MSQYDELSARFTVPHLFANEPLLQLVVEHQRSLQQLVDVHTPHVFHLIDVPKARRLHYRRAEIANHTQPFVEVDHRKCLLLL